ncbi:MAG: hypothetical protein JWO03_2248 [Bacteroidetes bacterium]|nr:hypothetical protein [Bacteroidota bacterium]
MTGTSKNDPFQVFTGTVKSYDEDAATCVVTRTSGDNEVDVPDVLLQAAVCDGLLILPAEGSDIIVGYSIQVPPFALVFSDVDKVYLQVGDSSLTLYDSTQTDGSIININDGSFGGLLKLIDSNDPNAGVLARLNKLETALTTHISEYNTHMHPTAAPGAPSAPSVLDTQTIAQTQRDDIENKLVTHGKV